MNKLTRTLLGGAASAVLAASPAIAGKPNFAPHVTALHAGRVVNKTAKQNRPISYITYTFGVSTSVPESDFHKTVHLAATFYKWNSYTDASVFLCGDNPRQKIKAPKKSQYAKIRAATETYSFGCSQPTVFYGDTYKLTDSSGFGQTDTFVSTLYGWFRRNGQGPKYKGTLNLDVSVAIGTD